MSPSSLHWMPRCWPSVSGSSTASSTASASFSSRRWCWWDRTWQALPPELSGPSALPGSPKVPPPRLNNNNNRRHHRRRHSSSNSSSTSRQGSARSRETPLPHRVTSAPWTTSCLPGFLWITRRWWAACRASSAAPSTPRCSRACSSSLEGPVSSRTQSVG